MKIAKFTKPLSVTLQLEVYSAIKTISDKREISMGKLVREIVKEALAKENFRYTKINP